MNTPITKPLRQLLRRLRRSRFFGAVVVLMPAISLFVFSAEYHEPWRDEAHVLVSARAHGWLELLSATRYDAHPPLAYAFQKLIGIVLPVPYVSSVFSALGYALLLLATYHCLRTVSSHVWSSALMTAALSLTFTYVYELGVVARVYGYGLALVLWSYAAGYQALKTGSRRAARRAGILCGVAALTSAAAAAVAGAVVAGLLVLSIASRRKRLAFASLWALPFFLVLLYSLMPFDDRVFTDDLLARPLKWEERWETFKQIARLSVLHKGWWLQDGSALQQTKGVEAWAIGALALSALSCLVLRSRRIAQWCTQQFPILVVVVSWCALFVIFLWFYAGQYRHHLFLVLPAIVLLIGWCIERRKGSGSRWWWAGQRLVLLLLLPWFVREYRLCYRNLAYDRAYSFSQTKEAALILPEGARVIAMSDWLAIGIAYWRPDLHIRTLNRSGDIFRVYRLDRARLKKKSLSSVIKEMCHENPRGVYLLRSPLESRRSRWPRCKSLIHPSRGPHAPTIEYFYLCHMPCSKTAG